MVGHSAPASRNYGHEVCIAWVNGLGDRSAAFAVARDPDSEDLYTKARAELLIVEIIWAGANFMTEPEDAFTQQKVEIVARSLHEFLNDADWAEGSN